jgi:hypothetical protein
MHAYFNFKRLKILGYLIDFLSALTVGKNKISASARKFERGSAPDTSRSACN